MPLASNALRVLRALRVLSARRALFASALLLAALSFSGAARCQEAPVGTQSLLDDPFTFDTGFAAGGWTTAFFPFGHPDRSFIARRTVRLDNGEVIVAGLVPQWGENNPANGRWNIGLVRYNGAGQYAVWTGGGPHVFLGWFVVYPNAASPNITDVLDLKVNGDYLYVLTDQALPDGDVRVVVFHIAGTLVGEYSALGTSANEFGAGMAFATLPATPPALEATKLYVAGTLETPGPRPVPVLSRFTVNGDGSLTRDSNLGAGQNLSAVSLPVPDSYCVAAVRPCHARITGVAVTSSLGGLARRVYLGGSVLRQVRDGRPDWDFIAVATDRRGVPESSFAGDGFVRTSFNVGEGTVNASSYSYRDRATAIEARTISLSPHIDEVFLAGEVAQSPNAAFNDNRGVGVVKLADNGNLVSTFGNLGGRALFGGCDQGCAIGQRRAVETLAMSLNGARIAIVGGELTERPSPGGGFVSSVSAALAIVRANGGALTEFTTLPLSEGGSPRASVARSVVAAGSQGFAVAGTGAMASSPNAFITARVISDRIFGDGFAN